jgi:hypothetical protein
LGALTVRWRLALGTRPLPLMDMMTLLLLLLVVVGGDWTRRD